MWSLNVRRVVGGMAVLVGSLAWGSAAQAHQRDFPITYDWFQASQGEHELELHEQYGTKSREFEHEIELEYGVTDRFMIAPYLVYGHGPDSSLHLVSYKLETRYQLGNYAPNRILPGLYLELEKPQGEKAEIEGKLILSQYSGHGADLSVNLVTEQSTESGSRPRYAVTFGYAALLGRHGTRGGFELYKDIDTGAVNAGPTLAFSPGRSLWMTVGYAFAVNGRGGEDQANASFEWEF